MSTRPVYDVLLLSSDDEDLSTVEGALAAAGHRVHRCHQPGASAFPCNGLGEAGCPVFDGRAVDVALDVRQHPWPRPTPREDGVTCALRARVPLVVAGRTTLHPFETYASLTLTGTDDVVQACESAVASRNAALAACAREAVVEVLRRHGSVDADVDASVTRSDRHLHLEVLTTPIEDGISGMAASRAASALRAADPDAVRITVRFGRLHDPEHVLEEVLHVGHID